MYGNFVHATNDASHYTTPPTKGCHYFLSGPRLPSQLQSVTVLGRCQFILPGEQRHVRVCVNNLPSVAAVTAELPGTEPASSRSLVQHATYCATTPPITLIVAHRFVPILTVFTQYTRFTQCTSWSFRF